MSNLIHCKNCNANIEIPDGFSKAFIKCPTCQKMTQVNLPAKSPGSTSSAAPARPRPAPPPSSPAAIERSTPMGTPPGPSRPPAPTAAPASRQPSPGFPAPAASPGMMGGGGPLPEIMKANKRVAGQACTVCQKEIRLGEDVHNCPTCSQPSHQNCWNRKNGCGSCDADAPSGQTGPAAGGGRPGFPGSPGSTGAAPAGDLIPCRWCKEPIIRGAKKCKHCGEFQKDSDRLARANSGGAEIDESDNWMQIILGSVLCLVTMPICIGAIFMLVEGIYVLRVMLSHGCGTVLISSFVPFYAQYFVWVHRHSLFENRTTTKVWVICSTIFVCFQILSVLAKAGG